MQLNEFLEKFLPEYERKERLAAIISPTERMIFNEICFPEALQNFANIICEKQRENCIASEWKANSSISTIIKAIGKAEQPKIDEL